jgi:hypothetical protein
MDLSARKQSPIREAAFAQESTLFGEKASPMAGTAEGITNLTAIWQYGIISVMEDSI